MRKGLRNMILNLIYPPRCVFCLTRLSPKTNMFVCHDCANTLPYTKIYNRCTKCGKPMADGEFNICRRCRTVRIYTTRITSAFVYTDSAKRAAVAFKKERNAGYAKTFAVYIEQMINSDFKNIDFDFVVSVPPRKKSAADENFDQAAYLARAVALRLGIPYLSGAMYQTDRIKKQSTLSYNERIKNVKDKFAVRKPDKIERKTLLLIDDICTTGATLNECAKTLKDSGAYRVYAATFATVPAT